jgi:hypothetical protein
MMLTALAVILVGIYLIVTSQSHVSSTGTLIWGIVVGALAFFDLAEPVYRRRAPP